MKLVEAILVSGRDNIRVKEMNTSVVRGLAETVPDLASGKCLDGVVSSMPDSNYSYHQVSSLLKEMSGCQMIILSVTGKRCST